SGASPGCPKGALPALFLAVCRGEANACRVKVHVTGTLHVEDSYPRLDPPRLSHRGLRPAGRDCGALMSRRPGPRVGRRRKTGKRRRRLRLSRIVSSVVPGSRTRRGWMRRFRRAPALMQLIVGLMLLCGLWFAANGIYQVVRKPSELFFP